MAKKKELERELNGVHFSVTRPGAFESTLKEKNDEKSREKRRFVPDEETCQPQWEAPIKILALEVACDGGRI